MLSMSNCNTQSRVRIIGNVARREWRRLAGDRKFYLFVVIAPLVLALLFAAIYVNRAVKDLPVVALDNDNSELSRMILRALDTDRSLELTGTATSLDEIKDLFKRGRIQGAIYIESGLEEDVKHGKQGKIVAYVNGANIIVANLLNKAISSVSRTVVAGANIQRFQAMGLSRQAATDRALPVKVESLPLFNPGYNYLNYLVPCLMIVLLQMIIMIASGQLINTELAGNTYPELVRTAGNSIFNMLAGKSIPHIFIHSCTTITIIGLLMAIFGIPIKGSIFIGIAFTIYFVIVSHVIGLTASFILPNPILVTEAMVFINAPAFVFSGYTFPIEAMPVFQKGFGLLMPFTHYLTGFIKIYQMGTPPGYLWPEFIKLSLYLIVAVIAILMTVHIKRPGYNNSNMIAEESAK